MAGPSDVFAVGDLGLILHYDGAAWHPMASGTTKVLLDVWGRSSHDVYASGRGGVMLHFDGSSWSAVDGAPFDILSAMWSTTAHVYATGQIGRVFRSP